VLVNRLEDPILKFDLAFRVVAYAINKLVEFLDQIPSSFEFFRMRSIMNFFMRYIEVYEIMSSTVIICIMVNEYDGARGEATSTLSTTESMFWAMVEEVTAG